MGRGTAPEGRGLRPLWHGVASLRLRSLVPGVAVLAALAVGAAWAGSASLGGGKGTGAVEASAGVGGLLVGADAAAPDLSRYAAFVAPEPQEANVPYDGRFTFVRVQFDVGFMSGGRRGFGREPPWAHDYPRAERHLMKILRETTYLRPYMDGGNIFALDDPKLFHYPLAYVSEPGYWRPTKAEAESLREYFLKGGFVIFDDFRGGDWYNFEAQMRRVLPEALIEPMDVAHPIFHAFFEIQSLDIAPPTFRQYRPVFYGIYLLHEDGRELVAIANYNNDIGDYWEWSDAGFLPIDLSNEAYKLGVNYVVYAMTH